MTQREVTECTKRIMKRKNDEARFNALIHGAKLKDAENNAIDMKPLSEEQKKTVNKTMEKLIREKNEEAARKKQGIRKGRR